MSHPRKRFSSGDLCVIIALALICAGTFMFTFFGRSDARTFTVRTPDMTLVHSLSDEREFTFESNGITLTVSVKDGGVSVVSSDCPDKICVTTGKISKPGQAIICIPARVVIEITEGGEQDEDFTVG